MTKNQTLHIRVNENVKSGAESTLEMLGLSISDAVNMFLCQVNLVGGLPFDVKLPAPERVIVKNDEEILEKLNKAEVSISKGKVSPADEVFERLSDKYGL
jgi:DNA-damage-inducible protein J